MEKKHIKPKKIYEEISDIIIERVKNRELKPGDALDSVEKTAEIYGVSRSTVREAFSGLRAMGLVDMRQGEGTFITSFDASSFALPVSTALIMQKNDIEEIAVVRRILEIGTVSLAAKMRTDEDIKRLEKSLLLMKDAEEKGLLGEKADLQFHMDIARASHNNMLINLTSSVSDITLESMQETRRLFLYSKEGMAKLYQEHLKIFQAIKNGNALLAENEMQNHLLSVENILADYLK